MRTDLEKLFIDAAQEAGMGRKGKMDELAQVNLAELDPEEISGIIAISIAADRAYVLGENPTKVIKEEVERVLRVSRELNGFFVRKA